MFVLYGITAHIFNSRTDFKQTFFRCEVSKLPKSSKQCICDPTNASGTDVCTDGGVEYKVGDIFGADANAEMCEYTRGDYIAFNEQLRHVLNYYVITKMTS